MPAPTRKPPSVKLPDDPNARYQVRDRADARGKAKVWTPPEGVTLAEAQQLVQHLAAHKRSSTARYEPLPPTAVVVSTESVPTALEYDFRSMDLAGVVSVCGDDPERWAVALCQLTLPQVGAMFADLGNVADPASMSNMQPRVVSVIAEFLATVIEAAVAVRQLPANATSPRGWSPPGSGPSGPASSDLELEAARQAALAAARSVAQAAQARHDAQRKPKIEQPPHRPPPSPLSGVVMDDMPDNEPSDDDLLDDADVHDLLGGVGAAPGAEDAKRAAEVAEREQREAVSKAEAAYKSATGKLPGVALPWSAMGKLARSQWTFLVTYGGEQPRIVSTDAHRNALVAAENAYRQRTQTLNPPAVAWESMDIDAREEWVFFVIHGGTVQPAIVTVGGA